MDDTGQVIELAAKVADEFKERKGSALMNWLIGCAKDATPILKLSGKFGVILGNILSGFGEVLVKAAEAFKVL